LGAVTAVTAALRLLVKVEKVEKVVLLASKRRSVAVAVAVARRAK
jgi:hypothetical protein